MHGQFFYSGFDIASHLLMRSSIYRTTFLCKISCQSLAVKLSQCQKRGTKVWNLQHTFYRYNMTTDARTEKQPYGASTVQKFSVFCDHFKSVIL